MKIETKDSLGRVNGWLLPVWNSTDGPRVDQVYVTVISQGMMKGPHLHKRRRGLFKVIRGVVQLVWRDYREKYHDIVLGPETAPFAVDPGLPAALYNRGMGDAYVLNMPSPAWTAEDPDEHIVMDWNF